MKIGPCCDALVFPSTLALWAAHAGVFEELQAAYQSHCHVGRVHAFVTLQHFLISRKQGLCTLRYISNITMPHVQAGSCLCTREKYSVSAADQQGGYLALHLGILGCVRCR